MALKLCNWPGAAVVAALLLTSAPAALAQPQRTAPSVTPTAERPMLLVDQIRSPPIPREVATLLQPLKTLEEVETLLRSKGIPFRRGRALIDTRTANATLVKAIVGLPPGEVFVIPERGEMTYNRVLAALTPEAAAAQMKPPAPKAPPAKPPPRRTPL